MPPEPVPWGGGGGGGEGDRKELCRERRHSHDRPSADSSSSSPLGGNPPPPSQHQNQHPPPSSGGGRWRESYGSSRGGGGGGEFGRWGNFGSSGPDYRRPPGHGKQGSWHGYHDEPGYGYSAPRSGNRFMEDDGFRPYGPRGDGRYNRGYRENRTFGHREWRGPPWENNHQHYGATASVSSRPQDVNSQLSANDALTRASPRSDSLNTSDQYRHSNQTSKRSSENGFGSDRRNDKENSTDIDWRPLKWSRSGSFTSRGSSFNHSYNSTIINGNTSDKRTELLTQKSFPVELSLGDPSASATSADQPEEIGSRKKPRLGWGEGLAKYEKKKVEGPDEDVNTSMETLGANNTELSHWASSSLVDSRSASSTLADEIPTIPNIVDCVSETTPPSIPCSSSPGVEDKALTNAAISQNDANYVSELVVAGPRVEKEVSAFNIDHIEPGSIPNLSILLTEILQTGDPKLVDPSFVKSLPHDKLMLWKEDIAKTLELTESEIDLLENELKSLRSVSVGENPCPVLSSSMDEKKLLKTSTATQTPPNLEVASPQKDTMDDMHCSAVGGPNSEAEGGGLDGPRSATSKYTKPSCMEMPAPLDEQNKVASVDVDVSSAALVGSPLVSSPEIETSERLAGLPDATNNMAQGSGISNGCPAAGENDVCNKILASNKAMAAKAYELLLESLPSCDFGVNHVNLITIPCGESKPLLKNLLQRKRFLKFKEKVLYLKFRACQHLWKEDLRLLSVRKLRAKSQKKADPGLRVVHNGYQKHRSSVRSRISSSAGSLSLMPTTEVISFTSKLLSDFKMKPYRDNLKMPALILDEKEKVMTRFISNNGLVEDPCAVERGRALINPWTAEEKEIFIEKLADFGKDFRKIASFLDHKTAADCIDFYYKNHKSESFARTKKPELKKLEKSLSANTYLVTTGKKWSREINSVSLDLLGEASAIAAQEDECLGASKVASARFRGKSRGVSGNLERSSAYIVEDDRETAAADVLAGICGSLSSEAVSSCITTSADPGENCPELKRQKLSSSSRHPLTPEATQNIDDETCSEESCGRMDPVDWTDEEKSIFVQAFSTYGKDFVLISRRVQTKSRDQCKVFFSKARKCLGLDMICPDHGNERTLASDDVSGSGSDSDGACVVEARSDLSTDKSGSRVDEDLFVSTSDRKHEEMSCEARNLRDEMKLMEHCDSGELENLPLDVQKADNAFPISCAGKVTPKREIEECMLEQNQVNANADDFGGSVNEEATVHSATVDEPFDANGELLGVSGSSNMGETMDVTVADKFSGENPSVNGRVCNIREIPSAQNDLHSSGNDAINRLADVVTHHSLSGQASVGHHDSSHVLNDYPLALPIKEEANLPVTHKLLSPEPSADAHAQPLQVFRLRKCSRTVSQNSVTELNFPYNTNVQSKKSEYHPLIPPVVEKPCGNGDVKLFGKILSKPLTAEKQTLHATGTGENGVCHSAPVSLFDIKESVDHNLNGKSTITKSNDITVSGGNLPARTYGFWDGTRIRTGYSSLSDSEMLLAKYPAAFGNLPLAPSKMEQHQHQQQLLPTRNNMECLLNGVSVLPWELSSNNGFVTEQPQKSQSGQQPFRLELLPRQDILDVHKRGHNEVPSYQPPDGRGVKLNVVNVENSGSSGISDPVAALKLHFAKSHAMATASGNANGNGIIVREEEPCRAQPGIGR